MVSGAWHSMCLYCPAVQHEKSVPEVFMVQPTPGQYQAFSRGVRMVNLHKRSGSTTASTDLVDNLPVDITRQHWQTVKGWAQNGREGVVVSQAQASQLLEGCQLLQA